ncbi:MAG TPA: SulP family inorganic anion transporter [Actinomycetota bacterium]|nr:SulP family inorganic anion transporter [Actinomycetota bacterium]
MGRAGIVDGRLRWRFPVLVSLDGYERSWIGRDVGAGVLIVAIAIPLSMGMAEVAGMPPVAGLYSCVLPLVAYAVFGSSRQLVIALDASTAAMLGAAVAPLAGGDPVTYAALAGAITIVAGLILLAAGGARLGFVADFLSEPVLLGYQAGLAIVVIVGQLPRMTGIEVEADRTGAQLWEVVREAGDVHLPTALVAATVLGFTVWLRAIRPAVPAALIAVAGATLVVAALDLGDGSVAVLGEIPQGLPPFRLPDVGWSAIRSLVAPAAAIALLAAADTLVSSRAFAARNGYRVDANRDLIGLGAANVSSGLSGGITTSASAARTAVAESVGSRSQVAGVTAACLMVLVLVFLTPVLRDVPTPALGAVVTAAVLRLFEPAALRRIWNVRRSEILVAVAAVLGVVLIGVLEGVVVAMGLSVIGFLRREARPTDAVLVPLPGRYGYHDRSRHPEVAPDDDVVVYRFDAPLFYANAERFRTRVRGLVDEHGADAIVVDAAGIANVDATSIRMLRELLEELDDDGVVLVLADPVGHVKDALVRGGLPGRRGEGLVFDTLDEGIDSVRRRRSWIPAPATVHRAEGPPE